MAVMAVWVPGGLAEASEIPVAPDILVLADMADCPMTDSVQRLYPDRVRTVNLSKDPCPETPPDGCRFVMSFITRLESLPRVKALFTQCGRSGLTLVTGLDEYAHFRGCRIVGTPILAHWRDLDPAQVPIALDVQLNKEFRVFGEDPVLNKPKIRFEQMRPWTHGFHVGDELPWYGLLDPAKKYSVSDKKDHYTETEKYRQCHHVCNDLTYQERLWDDWEKKKENFYYHKRLASLPADFHGTVVGVSTADGKPAIVEETFEKGAWIAMDFLSPEEPIFHFHWGEGCYNKYVLLGNICDATVRFGRFWTRWPTPDEYNAKIKALAEKHPIWTVLKETEYDYTPAGIESERKILGLPEDFLKTHYDNYSLNLGDRKNPIYLYTASMHGPESIGGLGLMSLAKEISETLSQDEALKRFLENYALKLMPLCNPLDYSTLFYRDPGSGLEWKVKNVNSESGQYLFFLGDDIHGNPPGGDAAQGNGRVVDEAVRRTQETFRCRYLDAPGYPWFGAYFKGYGNKVGEMRPRQRMYIYPGMKYRYYSMGTEMPDVRIHWGHGVKEFPYAFQSPHPHVPSAGKEKRLPCAGKRWPLQSFFTLALTDVIATYVYNEMLPHPWTFTVLKSPDPSWNIRLWCYHPDQTRGTMVATFRKADAKKLTDWEYLDVVSVKDSTPSVVSHPLDGRLHVEGLLHSFPLKQGALRSNRAWREEDIAGPTFVRWHWLLYPDAFRPLVQSHWVLWDADSDGQAETYMEDKENDGIYETRKSKQNSLSDVRVGYFLGKDISPGWADLSVNGFSALGTWIQALGGTVAHVKADDPFENLSLLIIGSIGETDLTGTLVANLKQYLQVGGRILVILPESFVLESEIKPTLVRNGETDWENNAANLIDFLDYEKQYKKRLSAPAQLCGALGVIPLPRKVQNYERIHGDWCWFDMFFDRKTGFLDQTGLKIISPHDRLMVESFVLEPARPEMKPLLLLDNQPVLVGGPYGKGWVCVSGAPDLFNNRQANEKLNEPLDWNQCDLPCPSRNIAVCQKITEAILRDQMKSSAEYHPDFTSAEGVEVSQSKDGMHVAWTGADNEKRHFALNSMRPGGPRYEPKVTLGLGKDQTLATFLPIAYIINRSRYDIELKYGNPFQIIIRNHQQFYPHPKNQAYNEYRFIFLPGKNYFLMDYRIEVLDYEQPFSPGVFDFRPSEKGAWKDSTDKAKMTRVVQGDNVYFGFIGKKGDPFRMTLTKVEQRECSVAVFSGRGKADVALAEFAAQDLTSLARNDHSKPHPLMEVWRSRYEAATREWQACLKEAGWLPSSADIESRWQLDRIREMLRTRRPSEAVQNVPK